jgi:hypothetical protein
MNHAIISEMIVGIKILGCAASEALVMSVTTDNMRMNGRGWQISSMLLLSKTFTLQC